MARNPPKHITRHPQRLSIELARLAGMSLDRVAAKFGVQRDAIARHMAGLDPDYRAALASGVPLEELAERANAEGVSLFDNLAILRGGLMQASIAAKAAGDHHAFAALARVALEVNREIGKLSGEILQTPRITSITNNALVIMSSPFMTQLEGMLARKLAPHPAALRDVLAGLEELRTPAADTARLPAPEVSRVAA